jgi:MFS family permease
MKVEKSKARIISKISETLDNVPFTTFHFRIVYSLGVSWIIDGYEVSLLSVLSGILKTHFELDDLGIAQAGSFYLLGCVFGALIFAYLSNLYGRKKLFTTTLIIYIFSICLTSFSFSVSSFYISRFLTGLSIGGEYTAIFAAIDELIPKKDRGITNIIIDGTWHLGSIIACLLSYTLLKIFSTTNIVVKSNFRDTNKLKENTEKIWRFLFLIGGIVALPIIFIRKYIPESPRWLVLQNKKAEAIEELIFIKNEIKKDTQIIQDEEEEKQTIISNSIENDYCNDGLEKSNDSSMLLGENSNDSKIYKIFKLFFVIYPSRFIYALALMISQTFFYNGLYYTFGLVLENYYKIDKESFGIYLIPLSFMNFVGPLILGKYFDTWSRKKMIALCYILSGLILAVSSYLFAKNSLSLIQQLITWCILFFFASPGSSAAHLTVSEIFPTEIRSEALATFFSISLLIGGVIAPITFTSLIDKDNRFSFSIAYFISSGLLISAGIISLIIGVDSENKSLEEISKKEDYKMFHN